MTILMIMIMIMIIKIMIIIFSCESNVTKCFSGSRLVLVASRDIMEREEVEIIIVMLLINLITLVISTGLLEQLPAGDGHHHDHHHFHNNDQVHPHDQIAESYLPGGGDQLDRDQRRAYLHHFYK